MVPLRIMLWKFGAMGGTKPYKFIESLEPWMAPNPIHVYRLEPWMAQNTYRFITFGAMYGTKTRAMDGSQTF